MMLHLHLLKLSIQCYYHNIMSTLFSLQGRYFVTCVSYHEHLCHLPTTYSHVFLTFNASVLLYPQAVYLIHYNMKFWCTIGKYTPTIRDVELEILFIREPCRYGRSVQRVLQATCLGRPEKIRISAR